MQRIKFLAIAVLFVLLGMATSSQAQQEIIGDKLPPPAPQVLKGTYDVGVKATEFSAGLADGFSKSIYGWGFYGRTEGDLSGHIFISANYAMASYGVRSSTRMATPIPVPVNIVTGGSWSKLIYVDGVYAGSISGTITSGTLTWDYLSETASVVLDLACDKGTGDYVGITCLGSFKGRLDRTQLDPTVMGALTLNF